MGMEWYSELGQFQTPDLMNRDGRRLSGKHRRGANVKGVPQMPQLGRANSLNADGDLCHQGRGTEICVREAIDSL
jgi:hypothetical protein